MESGDSPSEGVKGKALKPEIGELAAVVTCLSRCSPEWQEDVVKTPGHVCACDCMHTGWAAVSGRRMHGSLLARLHTVVYHRH